jgi:hypothetical protein
MSPWNPHRRGFGLRSVVPFLVEERPLIAGTAERLAFARLRLMKRRALRPLAASASCYPLSVSSQGHLDATDPPSPLRAGRRLWPVADSPPLLSHAFNRMDSGLLPGRSGVGVTANLGMSPHSAFPRWNTRRLGHNRRKSLLRRLASHAKAPVDEARAFGYSPGFHPPPPTQSRRFMQTLGKVNWFGRHSCRPLRLGGSVPHVATSSSSFCRERRGQRRTSDWLYSAINQAAYRYSARPRPRQTKCGARRMTGAVSRAARSVFAAETRVGPRTA